MSQPRIIRTRVVADTATPASLLEFLGSYWLLSLNPPELENAPEQAVTRLLEKTLQLYEESAPLLGRKGLGLSADDIKLFGQQLARWAKGSIDWDNLRQYNAYTKREGILFTDLYDYLITNPDSLSPEGRKVAQSFSVDETALIESVLGLVLGYGRAYTSARVTSKIKSALISMFPPISEALRTGADTADDGSDYEAPGWIKDIEAIVKNVIVSHPDLKTVEGSELTLDFSSLEVLKTKFAEEYKVYSSNYKKLIKEAYNCIIANLKMNTGQPIKMHNLHRLIKGDGVYLPPNMIASANYEGYVSLEKTSTGKLGLLYYSPFLEVLDKSIRGNVIPNPKYNKGSTEFVCKYVDPTSRIQTKNYAYTLEARKATIDSNYAETDMLIGDLDSFRKRWIRDMTTMTKAIEAYDAKLGTALKRAKDAKSVKEPAPIPAATIRNGVLGMMCELGYQVAPRVGGKGNATTTQSGRVPTYALTTLKLRHIVTTPRDLTVSYQAVQEVPAGVARYKQGIVEIIFDYLGKKAEHQFHKLSQSTLASSSGSSIDATRVMDAMCCYMALVTRQIRNHEVDEDGMDEMALRQKVQFFKVPNAHDSSASLWVDVHNRMINTYLKQRIKFPGNQTFKAFRKLKATSRFNEHMKEFEGELTKENLDSHVMKAAAAAGLDLGHAAAKTRSNGTMALSYYIVPSVVRAYYSKLGVEPNAKIARILNQNLREDAKD